MMSSSNQTAEHGEAISRTGRDHQAHDTTHVNSQANDSSRQMNGNINNNANLTIHPSFGMFPIPQDLVVEEEIAVKRTIRTGPGLMAPQASSQALDTGRQSRNSATSSLRRYPLRGASMVPVLALSSTESYKGGLATFRDHVLRFLIEIGSSIIFWLVIYLICQLGSSTPGQTEHVQCGFFNSWVDYDYPSIWRWRITLSDGQASAFILSTVLVLALLIPSTYNVFGRIGYRILCRFTHCVPVGEQNPEPNALDGGVEASDNNTERTPLIIREQGPRVWLLASKLLVSSRSANHTIRGLMAFVLGTSRQKKRSPSLRRAMRLQRITYLVLAMLATVIYFVLAIATLMSKWLVVGSVVLSQHPDCGVWWNLQTPSPKSTESSSYGWSPFGQEVEAGEYASKCYHRRPGTDGCNAFLAQKIPYDISENSPCPFEESLCFEGRSSAYSLTTGIISSKDLGINVPLGYGFRRNTTCSPLSRRAILSDDLKTFSYDYGASITSGNSTWTSNANLSWVFAGYNVATFYWLADNKTRDWEPNADFKAWDHQAITLMFIQSQKNYHVTPRRDPIFPAEQEVVNKYEEKLYYNADPIVPALACVDTREICSPDGTRCWTDLSNSDLDLPQIEEKIGYYMLALALDESTTFNAIQLQGGRTLEATHMLQRLLSLPLADEQWKVEAEHLFETSLARISITLRDYIRGAAAHSPNYEDWIEPGMGGMCHAYKFPGRGWVNISVNGIILIVCLATLSYFLSFEIGSYAVVWPEGDTENHERNARIQQTRLVIDWILDAIFGPPGVLTDEDDLTGESTSIPKLITNGGTDRETSPLPIPTEQSSQPQAPSENAGSQTESQVAVGAETENEHRAPGETEG